MWSRLKRVRLPAETSLGSCFDRVAHRLLGKLSYPSTGRQEQEGQGAGSSCFLSPSPLLVALLFPPSCPESPRQCLGTDWITTPSHRVVLWHGFALLPFSIPLSARLAASHHTPRFSVLEIPCKGQGLTFFFPPRDTRKSHQAQRRTLSIGANLEGVAVYYLPVRPPVNVSLSTLRHHLSPMVV